MDISSDAFSLSFDVNWEILFEPQTYFIEKIILFNKN